MRNRRIAREAGVTLIELLVALALMGLMAGVSALAFRERKHWTPPVRDAAVAALAAARQEAVRSGHPVTVVTVTDTGVVRGTAWPDGRVSAPGEPVDPLSGRSVNAR